MLSFVSEDWRVRKAVLLPLKLERSLHLLVLESTVSNNALIRDYRADFQMKGQKLKTGKEENFVTFSIWF